MIWLWIAVGTISLILLIAIFGSILENIERDRKMSSIWWTGKNAKEEYKSLLGSVYENQQKVTGKNPVEDNKHAFFANFYSELAEQLADRNALDERDKYQLMTEMLKEL